MRHAVGLFSNFHRRDEREANRRDGTAHERHPWLLRRIYPGVANHLCDLGIDDPAVLGVFAAPAANRMIFGPGQLCREATAVVSGIIQHKDNDRGADWHEANATVRPPQQRR